MIQHKYRPGDEVRVLRTNIAKVEGYDYHGRLFVREVIGSVINSYHCSEEEVVPYEGDIALVLKPEELARLIRWSDVAQDQWGGFESTDQNLLTRVLQALNEVGK